MILIGIVVIYTASLNISEANFPRHLAGIAIGAVVAILMWRYDYRSLANMSTLLLVVVSLLMILPRVPGLGVSAKGMTGWVKIFTASLSAVRDWQDRSYFSDGRRGCGISR